MIRLVVVLISCRLIPVLRIHSILLVSISSSLFVLEGEIDRSLRESSQRQSMFFRSIDFTCGESDDESSSSSLEWNEIERSKVATMRPLLLQLDPSTKEVDDAMLRRFLRARDQDIEKATSLLLKYLSWRRESIPNGYISPSEISNELAQNKVFMQGVDKAGRPIVVAIGARHKQADLDEFKSFVAYVLEKTCARIPAGQEKYVCIADLQGWGYTNSDIRGFLAALTILQDCYPERLGKLYIIHVPCVFMTAWNVVYPLIDNKTRKKIVFVEDKNLRSALLTDIDDSQIPETYGGKLPLVTIQDC